MLHPRVKDLSSCHSVETPNPGCPPGPISGAAVKKEKQESGLLPKDLPGKCRISEVLTQKLKLLQLFVVRATVWASHMTLGLSLPLCTSPWFSLCKSGTLSIIGFPCSSLVISGLGDVQGRFWVRELFKDVSSGAFHKGRTTQSKTAKLPSGF